MSASEPAPPATRTLPALGPDNQAYWTGGLDGALMITQCRDCAGYTHPPLPRCSRCGGANVGAAAVSGRGRVAAFTVNHQAWVPGLKVPYVFAAVELEEQSELYVFCNIVGCDVDEVGPHMPVEVIFEQHQDVALPQFRPRTQR
jgi:uncharacterized OB-fold protein